MLCSPSFSPRILPHRIEPIFKRICLILELYMSLIQSDNAYRSSIMLNGERQIIRFGLRVERVFGVSMEFFLNETNLSCLVMIK